MNSFWIVTAFIVGAALSGCQAADSGTGNAAAARTDSATAIKVSPGKPRHPLQVQLLVPGDAQAGVESAAELQVRSSYVVKNLEVELQPRFATVLSEDRFVRSNGELQSGGFVKFPFRFTASGDASEPVTVRVRATQADGTVMTREVTLDLATPSNGKTHGKNATKIIVPDAEEPAVEVEDVVVPARQEIRRD